MKKQKKKKNRSTSFIVNDAQNMNHMVGWRALLLSPSQQENWLLLLLSASEANHSLPSPPPHSKMQQNFHFEESINAARATKKNHHIFSLPTIAKYFSKINVFLFSVNEKKKHFYAQPTQMTLPPLLLSTSSFNWQHFKRNDLFSNKTEKL